MRLFTYGTLQPEYAERNYYAKLLVENCSRFTPDYYTGVMFDCGDYPGVVFVEKGRGIIYGTTYTIDDKVWEEIKPEIDRYESEGCLYAFKEIAPGVWSYEYNLRGLTVIPSGTWVG